MAAAGLATDWAGALADPAAFAREQSRLAQVWTLLGLTTDIPRDGDWFRATLGGRSVFVQRFGGRLAGFENVCAHRSFPLRTEGKGRGPIRCGFHHWRYDEEGRAIDIPRCRELFGRSPGELNARLARLDIAVCGMLVFGRFPPAGAGQSLEQFLGDGFAVLQALCDRAKPPYFIEQDVAANWKLCVHMTLDDYHIVAVHPGSFGKHGYIPAAAMRYFRFGWHSAYLRGATDGDAFSQMVAACRDGSYRPGGSYRILNFFPNLTAAIVRTFDRSYVVLDQYLPVAVDRTLVRRWFYPAPFPLADRGFFRNLLSGYVALWLPLAVRHFAGRIGAEDREACEKLQSVARQIRRNPILGLQEERIAWFEEAYAQAMASSPRASDEP